MVTQNTRPASLNQISFLFSTLRNNEFIYHGQLVIGNTPTFSTLWSKFFDPNTLGSDCKVSEGKYNWFLSLLHEAKHEELEAELDKLS